MLRRANRRRKGRRPPFDLLPGASYIDPVPRTVYIASSNSGKLREFSASAQPLGLRIAPLPGLEQIPPPPEPEPTFEGNAREKAIYYSRALPGEIVLADDSGLEVEALHGAPGVRSARYADDEHFLLPTESPAPASHTAIALSAAERNNLLLLRQLAGTPDNARGARYCCALAAARDSQILLLKQGFVSGRILRQARGSGGFGYDPLFYLPALGRTMAEISLETKDALSHRGKALRALLAEIA